MMEKQKIIDKLNFYWGFLHDFTERAENTLKEGDVHNLNMCKEWINEAIRWLYETD